LILTSSDTPPDSKEPLPEFKLKRYELLLTQYTDVRVPGTLNDHFAALKGSSRFNVLSKMDAVLLVNQKARLRNVFPTTGALPSPNFDSWCVRRWYGLEFKATVDVLGMQEEFVIRWTGVKLLARDMKDGEDVVGDIGAPERGAGESVRDGEDGLPAYEGGTTLEEAPRYEKVVDGNALGL
jgi:hypothetical protein